MESRSPGGLILTHNKTFIHDQRLMAECWSIALRTGADHLDVLLERALFWRRGRTKRADTRLAAGSLAVER